MQLEGGKAEWKKYLGMVFCRASEHSNIGRNVFSAGETASWRLQQRSGHSSTCFVEAPLEEDGIQSLERRSFCTP